MQTNTEQCSNEARGKALAPVEAADESRKFTIGMIVANQFGVLNQVTSLYRKRAYNIDSLSVGTCADKAFSRITVVSNGSDYIKEQIIKQLKKIVDVKSVACLEDEASLSSEHMLIKLATAKDDNHRISELIRNFGGSIIDFGEAYVSAEMTGATEQVDAFIEACVPLGIIELCRSGSIALSRGLDNVLLADA